MKLTLGLILATVRAVWRHPRLWRGAVTMAAGARQRYRPWPSTTYLRWRVMTAQGSSATVPDPVSVRHVVEWQRRMTHLDRMT